MAQKGYFEFNKIIPKPKEKTMWKKPRKRARRITMAWDLFGVFLLCRWVNPWVIKLWNLIIPDNNWSGKDATFLPWVYTITSIAVILATLYGLDRLAAWWYGEAE